MRKKGKVGKGIRRSQRKTTADAAETLGRLLEGGNIGDTLGIPAGRHRRRETERMN